MLTPIDATTNPELAFETDGTRTAAQAAAASTRCAGCVRIDAMAMIRMGGEGEGEGEERKGDR
jgi:hypothetical protein